MACKYVNDFDWLVLGKTQMDKALLRSVEPLVEIAESCPKAAPLLYLHNLGRLNHMRVLLPELLVDIILVHGLQAGVQQGGSNKILQVSRLHLGLAFELLHTYVRHQKFIKIARDLGLATPMYLWMVDLVNLSSPLSSCFSFIASIVLRSVPPARTRVVASLRAFL